MTHTHTVGTRSGQSMAAGATSWESLGLLNSFSDNKRTTGAFVSSDQVTASSSKNQPVSAGRRFPRPSFLRIELEDLHRGTFDEMNARIDALPKDSTLVGLFERLLANTEKVHGQKIVGDVLGLLWASRRGLSLVELTALVGSTPADVEDLCSALSSHLIKRDGLLTIAHDDFRSAIEQRFVTPETRSTFHSRIARFFAEETESNRRVDELPYQYATCGAWPELKETICDPAIAVTMLAIPEKRAELATYWRQIDGHYDAVSEYSAALDRAARAVSPSTLQEAREAVGQFLTEIGLNGQLVSEPTRSIPPHRRSIPLHRVPVLLIRRVRGSIVDVANHRMPGQLAHQ